MQWFLPPKSHSACVNYATPHILRSFGENMALIAKTGHDLLKKIEWVE
jgi:hypothetical protein